MRIALLDLIAYGPFRGLELDLSAPGTHLVFGRNEAGKSTTLRAITGLLYGIDTRTQDAHVHKPNELRVGGTLTGADGARVRLVRRKGVSKGGPNTLLDERGQAVDETVLQRLLCGVSEETFRHAFGLDHETLKKGAEALLEGRGDVGGSLFDASVGGGGDARRLLLQLTTEAERLYKPRASAPPLNDALRAFAEAQKAVKEKQSLPEAYVAQQRALDEATKSRAALATRRAELAARRAQIERARRRAPLERKRAHLAAILTAAGGIGRHAARIMSIHSRLAGYERATGAHRDDTAAAERLRDRVAEAARRAGVPAGSRALRIDVRTQSRIQRLVQERTTLASGLEKLRAEIARSERDLERERGTVLAPETLDAVAAAALSRAVEHARKLGDLAGRHATELARAARRRSEVEARVATLGVVDDAPRTVDALVALRPPSESMLDALATRAVELDRAIARQAERLADLETDALSLARQLAEASGDFAPPSAADLKKAREARDEAWARLQGARTAAPDASGLSALESAFERSLREADVVADRMLGEADRVITLSRLRALDGNNAQQRAHAKAEHGAALAQREALDAEHRRLWVDAGITPRAQAIGLAEMRAWLAKHAQIVDAFAGVREAEADAKETARTIEVAREELASAVAGAGASADPSATLAGLLDIATARLERIEESRRSGAEAARTIARLEGLIDERRATVAHDEAALAELRARVGELVAPLGVPDDASADEVTHALDALRELFSLEDQRADVEARAAAAGAEARAFEEEAARAAVDLAAELVGLPARAIALELAQRAQKAHDAEVQLAELDTELHDSIGDAPVPDDVAALVADPDAAARAVEEVDAALAEVDHDLTREVHSIGGIEVGLEKMRADSGAAEASAQAQEALARVRLYVERFVRAKVAAVLLAREIDRYREENQGPMLTKASQLFARLTLGGFTGVRAGYDERDRPALRCIREGNAEVDVTGLSEGTRDQLYLSLRLASLLHYADIAEPMPLVLDDVLIQFDDERSRAALGVIAEVATRMQVLFFTHHARMVDLARAAVPASALTVHELAGPQPLSAEASAPAH